MKKRLKQVYFWDFAMILAVMVWGSTFYMIKGHLDSVDAVTMLVYRFCASALILALYLIFKGQRHLFLHFHHGAISGFFLWILYVSQNIGMKYTSATNSGFITALYVAFIPLSSYLVGLHPKVHRVFSAMLATLGLWILTGGIDHWNKGDLITFCAPISVTIYMLLSDNYLKKGMVPPLILGMQQFLTVGILSFIWALVFDSSFVIERLSTYAVLLYFIFGATLFTFLVYLEAQKRVSPLKIAMIFVLEPVFAALFAYLFGGESLRPIQMFGAMLIIIALFVSEVPWNDLLKNRKLKRSPS